MKQAAIVAVLFPPVLWVWWMFFGPDFGHPWLHYVHHIAIAFLPAVIALAYYAKRAWDERVPQRKGEYRGWRPTSHGR